LWYESHRRQCYAAMLRCVWQRAMIQVCVSWI
jgi:hypothetical protein